MSDLQDVVGLFGTVGDSDWRDSVIKRLEAEGVAYFNPVVADWTPEMAEIEAHHLATDRVLLLVITGDTQSFGSLAETGWAALSAEQHGQVVFLVVQDYGSEPNSDANRARKLVQSHAKEAGVPVYEDIDTAVDEVIKVFKSTQ